MCAVTQVMTCKTLDRLAGCKLYFKCEIFQRGCALFHFLLLSISCMVVVYWVFFRELPVLAVAPSSSEER
jgi:hypothetical protein